MYATDHELLKVTYHLYDDVNLRLIMSSYNVAIRSYISS